MPRVDESTLNKGVNNNTQNRQMAINMEYQNRLNHPRFKSPYLGAKYQQKWSSYDLDSKAVLGLKILNKLGTPIIVRTPWLYR